MRRPVKPFVTEYRGVTRRPPAPPGLSPKPEDDIDTPPSKWPAAEGPRRFAPPVEDGYEAALRAADALFSGAPARAEARAQFSPSRQPIVESAPIAGGSGRILQAIEAASPEPLLAPEDAPKRRGRKPGSKNKPKIVALLPQDATLPNVEWVRDTKGRPDRAASAAAHDEPDAGSSQSPPIDAHSRQAAGAQSAEDPAASPVKVATERTKPVQFPWVRTKLKAGENWKRRLPKVLW